MTSHAAGSPLARRVPGAAAVPRAGLGAFPTPVERLTSDGTLWIKRDDRSAPAWGGNKIRALEFLLGALPRGSTVLTVGGVGSTHVLTLATVASTLGLRLEAIRWPHDMNPEAERAAAQVDTLGARLTTARGPLRGLFAARIRRWRADVRWIPLGGTTPLGMLGHVNAGLELAEQIAAGALPPPDIVVLPFGTGGTAAGIALGLHLAGLTTMVAPVRVGPRLFGRRAVIRHHMRGAARLLRRLGGSHITLPPRRAMRVVQGWSGGAYGRPEPRAASHAAWLRRQTGIRLDGTYSAKAFGAAREMAAAGQRVLFWLTFDGRWLGEEADASAPDDSRTAPALLPC